MGGFLSANARKRVDSRLAYIVILIGKSLQQRLFRT